MERELTMCADFAVYVYSLWAIILFCFDCLFDLSFHNIFTFSSSVWVEAIKSTFEFVLRKCVFGLQFRESESPGSNEANGFSYCVLEH